MATVWVKFHGGWANTQPVTDEVAEGFAHFMRCRGWIVRIEWHAQEHRDG